FGGDTFPIGVGAGGNIDNITVFRMKKEMSMFVEKSEYQLRLDKISGLFQFPVVEKNILYPMLEKREKEIFTSIIDEFKEKKLINETIDNYTLTKDGLFWGNNIS
ncbi:MAG: radical SAM protein, partial [Cetobacterium sp.]